EGLRVAGDLHVCLIDNSRHGARLCDEAGYTTSRVRARNVSRWTEAVRLGRLLPSNVSYQRAGTIRNELGPLIGRVPWDVVWCSRARVHLLTEDVAIAPRIVDFDDLRDRLLLSEITDRKANRGVL